MGQQLAQRLDQHVPQAEPAGDDHASHQQRYRRQQPHHLGKGALVLLSALCGERGLPRAPFAVGRLHRVLGLFDIEAEHALQIARLQALQHPGQAVVIAGVLRFETVAQRHLKTRRRREVVIDFEMAIGLRQLLLGLLHQLV